MNASKAANHLRLIYDQEQAEISVPPLPSPPNGGQKDETEQAKHLLEQYFEKKITRNALYGALKKLWGHEGFEGTRECHENMKQRCKVNYASLSPEFKEFPRFLYYMGPRPGKEYTLNRIDNTKGYLPDNCEWADKTTQSRNRRNTVVLTCDDETRPLVEWAELKGVSPRVLRDRKSKGWNDHDVIYGRSEQQCCQTPNNFSWPAVPNIWEKKFRQHGGKTNVERYAFILKLGKLEMQGLNSRFREDWQFDGLSKTQEAALNKYNALYDAVQLSMEKARHELLMRGRHDLIDRCNDESISIETLFPKKKCNRFQYYDEY